MTFTVRKVGAEWCAFHPSGKEIARSHTEQLLRDYINGFDTQQEQPAMTLTKISYRTRARSTGAATASGRTADGWGAMCVSHGTVIPVEGGGTAAEKMTSKPQEWCPSCTAIALGEQPKIARNAELDELL